MFRRKKSVSARAEETPPADDASLWSDDSADPERGTLTRGAVRGLPGDGSVGDASPSSRSQLSVDSAASTPSRARSVSTDRWRRDALDILSARALDEETREARELAAREARQREEEDRKHAGVLASLPSALASRLRRSRKPASARGDGGSSADGGSDLGTRREARLTVGSDPGASDGWHDTHDTSTLARAPGLSRVGPHPCERKRAEGEEPSRRLPRVARVALAVLPARGAPREGTEGTLEALRRDGFEIRETLDSSSFSSAGDSDNRMVSLSRMLECGAVVNGLEAVDAETWKNYRAARAAGVLVFNYDRPGLYGALDAHVDVTCAVSKFVPPYSVDLEARCDTKEDGYREVLIHVVSGPDHDAERVAMRDAVLPRLVERCRARRIRPVYVDLRSDAAGCGPGHALRTADVARRAAVHVVLLSGKHEPERDGDARVKAFVDKVPRGGGREAFAWLSRAPSDYSRSEMVVAHVLRLAQTPDWLEAEEAEAARERARGEKENDDAGSAASSKSRRSASSRKSAFSSRASETSAARSKASKASSASRVSEAPVKKTPSGAFERDLKAADAVAERAAPSLGAAGRRASLQTEQHVLAYARGGAFYQKLAATDPEELDEFLSQDPYERERVASFLSTMYAHPNVAVRVYDCAYAPGSRGPGGGAFVTGVPAHAADLAAFADAALEDIWSRISYEFAPNPAKDIVAWHERQPEFALQNALPVYFNRGVPEHTITRCVKLGRPKVICLSGAEGRGVTSVMQRCARECRRSFGNLDGRARDEVVVLSVFPKVGGAPLTPTRVFARLTAQLAAARRERGAGGFGDAASGFNGGTETLNGARGAFLDAVRVTIGPTRRVAVFIDDATAVENPLGLAWMVHEREIPTGCQVICGARGRDEKLFGNGAPQNVLLTEEGIAKHAPDRLLRAQIAGLAACLFDSVARPLSLRPMSYAERKLYVAKHARSVFAEFDEALVSAVLATPGVAHLPYAKCLVERLLATDADAVDVTRLVEKKAFPTDHRAMLREKLESLELAFPKPTLALVLPAVALGRCSLTAEDVAALVAVTLREDEEAYMDAFIVPALLHAARDFIAGPFEGTFGAASDLAADIVLERYAPDEPARRAAFRMLAEYYGDLDASDLADFSDASNDSASSLDAADATRRAPVSPGRGLLRRWRALAPDALARDGDGGFARASAFQEHHLVCDALLLLPYYLTKARRFGELCALFRDFSFLQAKLEAGEGAALVADFDRALRFPRPPWLEAWDGGDARVGSRAYFAAKRVAEKALGHACVLDLPQYDRLAFQKWMGDAFGEARSAHGDVVAYRHLVWRNLRELTRRPHAILQVAMNAPGDAEPGAAAEDIVRRLAPPPEAPPRGLGDEASSRVLAAYRFADAAPGEAFLLLWSNRPDEAPFAEFRDAAIHAEPVTRACWIDDAAFVTAAEDGLVGVWSAQTGECAARLRGHERAVTSVVVIPIERNAAETEPRNVSGETGAFSEHGLRVATASLDGTVRVWHVEGELGRTCDVLVHDADGRAAVNALALAPDAGELLSVGDDGVAVCWDVLSRGPPRRVHATHLSHAGPCTSVACSPDGSVFVTGGADKTLQVWSSLNDAENAEDASTVFSSACRSAASRWRRRAEGKEDVRSIRSFASRGDARAPEQVLRLDGHLAEVTCVAFGRDAAGAACAASGSADHAVMLWNVETGVHVGILTGHLGPITDVSFSKDHELILSASADRTTRLWRARTGEVVLALNHGARPGCARLSPDASRLLAGDDGGAVSVWGWLGREGSASMGQGPQRPNLFARGHFLSDVGCARGDGSDETPTKTRARRESESDETDSATRRRRAEARRKPNPFAFDGQAHKGAVTCIASFARRERGGSADAAGREPAKLVSDRERADARAPAVTGGVDGYVRVVSAGARDVGRVTASFASLRRRDAAAEPTAGAAVVVHGVAASPDGTRALAARGDGTVVEWDVVTGVERAAFAAHAGAARAAAYADGALLGKALSGGDDGVVRLWTLDDEPHRPNPHAATNLEPVSFRGHAGRVTGLALGGASRGDVAASCGADRAALLWDARRGVAKASFVGHAGALTGVALGAGETASGSFSLMTASVDRTVRFWDSRAPPSEQCVCALRLDSAPAACAAAGEAQPHWFASCGADGVCVLDARVWREVAHFAGLAPLTALAFHGESKLFAGDADGRLYALDVWKAPPRSWE